MLTSKTKVNLPDAPNHRISPATPKVSKAARNGSTKLDPGSPSPVQKPSSPVPRPRASVDRSPKPTESKPPNRTSITPEKIPRVVKASELQAKFGVVEEDLKKAREQLAAIEREKVQALEALNEATRSIDETNSKLKEAIAAKKKAEEKVEIEKLRADELQRTGIEAAQRSEEKYRKEIESLRNQHAIDASALLSATEELKKVKLDLTNTVAAKKASLSQANEAKRIAEANEEKVEILSNEIIRLKALLDSKLDNVNKEASEMIKKLDAEINDLNVELEKAKAAKEKMGEMTAKAEKLQVEVTKAKKAESDAAMMVDELKKRAASLEAGLKKANQSEKSASRSLATVMKQLEQTNTLLHDAQTEVTTLRGKIKSLENELAKHKSDLKESDRRTELAQQEATSLGKTIEMLKTELKKIEAEKLLALEDEKVAVQKGITLTEQRNKLESDLKKNREEVENLKRAMDVITSALHENEMDAASNVQNLTEQKHKVNNELKASREKLEDVKKAMESLKSALHDKEKDAASNIQRLTDEKNKLKKDLKTSREEVENVKKSMEGLASALQEMSSESKENQEKLLTKQTEIEKAQLQIEQKNSSHKKIEEKYKAMLEEKRHEIVRLHKTVEKYEHATSSSNAEWQTKELNFVNAIKRSEEELSSLKVEMSMVGEKLKVAELEAQAAKADGNGLLSKLTQAESGTKAAHQMVEEVKAETLQMKEQLMDKENELQRKKQENEDLRMREAAALQTALSALLAEATAKTSKENGELSNSDREYESPLKSLEYEESAKLEDHHEDTKKQMEETTKENQNEEEKEEQEEEQEEEQDEEDPLGFMDQGLISERHHEDKTIEDDFESKLDDIFEYQQLNGEAGSIESGTTSPAKQNKKKKALLHKFGNLLKKKGSSRNGNHFGQLNGRFCMMKEAGEDEKAS